MESPLKTKNRVPYDPAVLLLGIYLQETLISKDACAPVFLVALFTIAKTKKQLNVHQQKTGQRRHVMSTQWNTTQPLKRTK